MRQLCAALGVVVVVVAVVVAVSLKETTNTVVNYRTSDQVAVVGLGLLLAGLALRRDTARVDS